MKSEREKMEEAAKAEFPSGKILNRACQDAFIRGVLYGAKIGFEAGRKNAVPREFCPVKDWCETLEDFLKELEK